MQKIQRRTVPEEVAEQLLRLITGGQYEIGDRLPTEQQLMEQFGVGRSSVREGLQRLVSLGLVSISAGRGATLVNKPYDFKQPDLGPLESLQKKRMDDLLAARRVMELGVVEMVVRDATEEDFAALQAVVDEIRRRLDRGESVANPAAEFHVVLARASHNWIMVRLVKSIFDILREHGQDVIRLPGWPEQEYALHQRLLDVLRRRDPDEARREMEEHLRLSFAALKEAFARRQTQGAPQS
jgi:GntR family transcriptional regulator, transcriptional repressor for pyruvate dehydrogenase complex